MNNTVLAMYETMKRFVELEDTLYHQLRNTCKEEFFDSIWDKTCQIVIDKLWFNFNDCDPDSLYKQLVKYIESER